MFLKPPKSTVFGTAGAAKTAGTEKTGETVVASATMAATSAIASIAGTIVQVVIACSNK
jgi:hypothetical protein